MASHGTSWSRALVAGAVIVALTFGPGFTTRLSAQEDPGIIRGFLLQDDEVKLVVGSGGSKRIRTALVQVLSRLVDFGVPVQEAVEAPRMHWDGSTVQLEPGFNEAAVTSLAKRWPVNLWPSRDVYFGGVHAVVPGKEGAGDPRRGGAVSIVDIL